MRPQSYNRGEFTPLAQKTRFSMDYSLTSFSLPVLYLCGIVPFRRR